DLSATHEGPLPAPPYDPGGERSRREAGCEGGRAPRSAAPDQRPRGPGGALRDLGVTGAARRAAASNGSGAETTRPAAARARLSGARVSALFPACRRRGPFWPRNG